MTPHATATTKANQPTRETRNSESDRKKTLRISLQVAGADQFKCLSKLMYANQLLDLPFLDVTHNERQECHQTHFFPSCRIIKA